MVTNSRKESCKPVDVTDKLILKSTHTHTQKTINIFGYPEQYLCHGLLCCLREAPQVVVQCRVHHAGVHGVGGHREPPGAQLLLQVVGEENQRQFALSVSAMGTVMFPAEGSDSKSMRLKKKTKPKTNHKFDPQSGNGSDRRRLQVLPPV